MHPLTVVTNKHLLPLYNKPVICHPIEKLVEAGVRDILIITSNEYNHHFVRLLDDGSQFGARLQYEIQSGPNGIADALRLAEKFVAGEKVAVVLGDNIFEDSLAESVKKFQTMKGAAVFVKKHENARDYGVVELKDGKVFDIEEKPLHPKSDLCATGIYLYDPDVFEIAKKLKPSKRGEYEITDINRAYLQEGKLYHFMLTGEWFDCGNFNYLLKANLFIARKFHQFDA